jgi:argininosuccinate lyase
MPFRQAHGVVARLVADCVDSGRTLVDLTPQELQTASPLFAEMPELTARASVGRKRTSGSTNPDEVSKALEVARLLIEERRKDQGHGVPPS